MIIIEPGEVTDSVATVIAVTRNHRLLASGQNSDDPTSIGFIVLLMQSQYPVKVYENGIPLNHLDLM